MGNVSFIDGHIDEVKTTTLEYMEKELEKHKRNYDCQVNRQAPEKDIENIRNKIEYYSEVCGILRLYENGNVIFPPCNVGDKVWLIKSLNWQQTEWGIKEGKISMIQQKADKSWKFRVTENHSVQDYTVDKIGKTVFLTKEEAEKALRKEDEGK